MLKQGARSLFLACVHTYGFHYSFGYELGTLFIFGRRRGGRPQRGCYDKLSNHSWASQKIYNPSAVQWPPHIHTAGFHRIYL